MKAILTIVFGGVLTWAILSCSGDKNSGVGQNKLDWTHASSKDDIDNAWNTNKPTLFFKHSTRCGLSMKILEDFQNEWNIPEEKCKIIFIDILKHRDVSDYLAEKTGERHHSPQVFLIEDDKIKYHKTHMGIKVVDIKQLIDQ